MKITTLLGSAKKKGNTATVLGWVEEELKSLGHDVEQIYLHNKTIKGCMGCAKCRETPDEIACVQKDDAIAVMEKMIDSDVVLFTSPLYFWSFSTQIKAIMDRTYSLVTNYHQPDQTSLLKDKRIGMLVTGAGPYDNNAEALFTAFDRYSKYLMAGKVEQLFVDKCSTPSELSEAAREKAVELARALVG